MRTFQDSCQLYNAAEIALRYTSKGTGANVDSTNGRRGGQCLKFASAANGYVTKVLSSKQEWYVGVAYKQTTGLQAGTIIQFLDGSTVHTDLRVTATGALQITRNGTQLGITDAGVVQIDTYIHIQFYVKIADSPDGAAAIRINGSSTPLLNLTGVDTRNAGNASADTIKLGGGGSSYFAAMCDIVVNDTTGSYNNSWPGDVKVDAYMPNANGNYNSQWTPSSGDRYACVDEKPNNTTDYIESSTPNDLVSMGFPAADGGAIQAIQVAVYGQKTDAGARSIAPLFRHESTDSVQTTQNLSDSYTYIVEIEEVNPVTSEPWVSGYQAEAGLKLVA